MLTLKKFPIQDVCRVFNVLSRTCQYWDASMFIGQNQGAANGKKLIGTGDHDYHQKFLREVVGRIRHQIYEIPKDQFALTISNLIEFQQPDIAKKFVNILKELERQDKEILEEFAG